jgi:hypothetical protein
MGYESNFLFGGWRGYLFLARAIIHICISVRISCMAKAAWPGTSASMLFFKHDFPTPCAALMVVVLKGRKNRVPSGWPDLAAVSMRPANDGPVRPHFARRSIALLEVIAAVLQPRLAPAGIRWGFTFFST